MKVSVKNPGLSELDELCVQTIRFLSADAIQKANAGHPGMSMGMAPAAYILWIRDLMSKPTSARTKQSSSTQRCRWTPKTPMETLYIVLPREFILTTLDKLKALLNKHIRISMRKLAWINPLFWMLSLLVTLVTVDFKDRFFFPASVWKGVFEIAFVTSVGWFVSSVFLAIEATRQRTDIETDVKNESMQVLNQQS